MDSNEWSGSWLYNFVCEVGSTELQARIQNDHTALGPRARAPRSGPALGSPGTSARKGKEYNNLIRYVNV